ncbi:hypothetical protein HYDPIDRAFT_186942 [Hydnomerulius pinastri MD-312]|nr:hypothetical protein HYDPIDRAFT_186942 [Hydnomerulius pinastri MD-312]
MRCPTRFCLSLTFLSWASVAYAQCMLKIPPNPLTAQGLAIPYELTGCNQLDFANEGVFVEAAILDPATGSIQIYNPLVINAGMVPIGQGQNGTSTSSTAPSSTIVSPSSVLSQSSASAISSSSSSTGTKGHGSSAASSASPSTSSVGKVTSSAGVLSPSSSVLGGATTVSAPSTTVAASTSSSKKPATTLGARQAATSAGFFVPPIVPTLPNGAIVGLWFGSNANSVTLTGATGGCVNGVGDSVFGQFAYCNGQAWFNAAKTAVQQGLIKVPAPGTGSGGQACPVTRDFRIVDQDQSDNVVTTYLMIGNNTLAQNTPTNAKANPDAEVLSNASDNALVNEFIQPSLGCTAYQNPCTTCPSGQSPALATNELQSNFFPPAGGPALVPLNDPMVLINGQQSLQKVNLYRDGTGQPQADNNNASGLTYCQQFTQSGLFINLNQQAFTNTGSPAADQATNLFTFLAMRFSASFGPAPGLGCTQLLNIANPVTLTTDGNGIVTAATINTQVLQQIFGGLTGTTSATTSAVQTSSASAKTSAAASITSASHTGVLLESTTSVAVTPTGTTTNPSMATSKTTAHHKTHTHSSSPAAGTTAVGQSTGAVGVPTSPVATATPTATPTSPAMGSGSGSGAVTVTVTVTATVCPSQTASWTPPSPSSWHKGSWSGGSWGAPSYKRAFPFAGHDRMQRKSRLSSS